MKSFNIDKYIDYQNQLYTQFKNKEITLEEYNKLSSFYNEHQEIEQRVDELRKYISDNNLPFTIEVLDNNIQTLIETHTYLLDQINKFT